MQLWKAGFVGAMIWVGFWPFLPAWPVPLLLACSACYCGFINRPLFRLASGIAVGCALAIFSGYTLLEERLTDNCVKKPLLITGVVSSMVNTSRLHDNTLRQRFDFSVDALLPAHCSGPSLLLLSYYGDDLIVPGERWQFEVTLKKPWGMANPGSYNLQAWMAQRGVSAIGSVRRAVRLPNNIDVHVIDRVHKVRQSISDRIASLATTQDVRAILQALTVADKSAIDSRLWTLLQTLGINHLLVISGLHVGLVAAAGMAIGALFVRVLPGMAAVGLLPLVSAFLLAALYSALAGFTLPTQRALCMLVCFVLAGLLGRKSGSGSNLLWAAVVVLMINPLAAVGSGFWLSFSAVAALLWLSSWQSGRGYAWRLLQTHGFMALLMMPLGAWFFGGASLVSWGANLVLIPLVGMLIVPLALFAVVCFLLTWPMEAAIWQLAAWPLEQLLFLAGSVDTDRDNSMYQYITAGLSDVLLALLASALLVLPVGRSLKLIAMLLLLPLFLPAKVTVDDPHISTDVTVLDVGQGTALVIQSGHRALLYDTGGGNPHGPNLGQSVVLPYLRQRGVQSLDTFVISHSDLDHSAGARAILSAMRVGRLRYGGEAPDGVAVASGRPCVAGESWRWPGGQVFQFLSPAVETALDSNNSSCVLQVEIGDYRLLLPGDLEAKRERALAQYWGDTLKSDWLLVPHHGSQTSSSWVLLKHVQPKTAVISSGYANRFGHPHQRVTARLEAQGSVMESTAAAGALTFSITPGKTLTVRSYRAEHKHYWM